MRNCRIPLKSKGRVSAADPPPEMRSPALAATKRRANRSKSASKASKRRQSTKSITEPQAVSQRSFAINFGRRTAGYVLQDGGAFIVRTTDGRSVGTFAKLKEAADALSPAHGGAS